MAILPRQWCVESDAVLQSIQSILWASYQIRKIAGCACAGNAGNVFPRRRFQRKPLVSDPGMHHGTCVTHVPWCMSGSRTRGGGENVPGIPGACAPAISRIWQEAQYHKGMLPLYYSPFLRGPDLFEMICHWTKICRDVATDMQKRTNRGLGAILQWIKCVGIDAAAILH